MSSDESDRLRREAQAEATRAHMAHDEVNSAVAGVFDLATRAGHLLGIADATPAAALHDQMRASHRLLTDADAALLPHVEADAPAAPHVEAARAHIAAAKEALGRANDAQDRSGRDSGAP